MDHCAHCGMTVAVPSEYHPYAACLMFNACHDSEVVRANLIGVIEYGIVAGSKDLDSDQAFHDTRLSLV